MNRCENQPIKVLLVDDDPKQLELLQKALSQLNLILYTASSGSAALNLTLEHKISVMIIDIDMPGMSGIEVSEIMSWDENNGSVVIIYLAETLEQYNKIKPVAHHQVDCLFKPIAPDMLISKVQMVAQLREQTNRYNHLLQSHQTVLESALEGIICIDADGYIQFVNPAAGELLGWQIDALMNHSVSLILANEDYAINQGWRETNVFQTCVLGDIYHATDSVLMRQDGRECPVEFTATPIHDENTTFQGIILVFSDISARKNLEMQFLDIAQYDYLTDLPNRLCFDQMLIKAIARAKRHPQSFGLVLIDIDQLEMHNERFGYEIGNKLLQEFAARLEHNLRENDELARLGDDEFGVILDDLSSEQDALTIIENLKIALSQPYHIQNHILNLSCSMGLTRFPELGEHIDELMTQAQTALEKAKQSGENSALQFAHDLTGEFLSRMTIQKELKHALDHKQLKLAYQPRFTLDGKTLQGADCQITWEHGVHGHLRAAQFLPLIDNEASKLILDEYVLKTTLACLEKAQSQDEDLLLAICLDSVYFIENQCHETISAASQKSKALTSNLEIKLKEEVLKKLHSPEKTLTNLRQLGVAISLDDFGENTSHLRLLHQLPITSVNFSASMAKEVSKPANQRLMSSLIHLCKELNLKTLAKCVEDQTTSGLLRSYGCDYGFGYCFEKPMTEVKLQEYIKQYRLAKS